MQVIPSIDVEHIADLSSQLQRLIPYYTRFQIDFADGLFVPFTTPPLEQLLVKLLAFQNSEFDLHIMSSDYHKALLTIDTYTSTLRIKTIFIHHSANPRPELFIDTSHPYRLGLVLNPEDKVETIKQTYELAKIENIQLMTVHPGPQGSPFLSDSLNKIDHLKNLGYRNYIFLDGGINKESLEKIKQLKNPPDFICPGSYFSQAVNIEERVQYLSEVLNNERNANQNTQDNIQG